MAGAGSVVGEPLLEVVDDRVGGRSRQEDLVDAGVLEPGDVPVRDDAAGEHEDVGRVLLREQAGDLRQEAVVGPDRIDRPTARTSSWTAALAIWAGVCRRPL